MHFDKFGYDLKNRHFKTVRLVHGHIT